MAIWSSDLYTSDSIAHKTPKIQGPGLGYYG